VGCHTFRHTYRSWLDATEAPLCARQELMRHAHNGATMDYGNSPIESKRNANSKLVCTVLWEGQQQENLAFGAEKRLLAAAFSGYREGAVVNRPALSALKFRI
jgi:hypothetical protein